jgi:type II secretory pathway pseudopilin PulG
MRGPNRTDRRSATSDRGVSEVVGYTLTLIVVLASVAIVLGVGVPGLEDVKGAQQDENAEGAFVRVATKFGELGDRGAPHRAGQLSVSPGQLSVDDARMAVTVSTPSGDRTRTFTLRSLTYQRGDTVVALEGDGVFRADDGASVTVARPAVRCADGSAVVTVSTLVPEGATTVNADLVTVAGRHRNTTLWYPVNRTGPGGADAATAVTVDPDSSFEAAWERSLREAPNWEATGSGAFRCEADSVYVRHVRIGVEFV